MHFVKDKHVKFIVNFCQVGLVTTVFKLNIGKVPKVNLTISHEENVTCIRNYIVSFVQTWIF